ncbi:protein of unknown function [Methanoculleus bourgensis]|uniref:Uncharacterized protein n=1 Tax=Methanoculleus bourgensis TaxID=83986 RepID=A0A0X3BL99_9EURY|nr:protein of unknown function [Methanoculleus bourgensis]
MPPLARFCIAYLSDTDTRVILTSFTHSVRLYRIIESHDACKSSISEKRSRRRLRQSRVFTGSGHVDAGRKTVKKEDWWWMDVFPTAR